MNIAKTLLLSLAATTLCACSAIKYNVAPVEPTDGDRARIRLAIPAEGNGRNVLASPNSKCADVTLPGSGRILSNLTGFEKTLNHKKIGMPESGLYKPADYVNSEIFVRAGQPITVWTFKVPSSAHSESVMNGVKYVRSEVFKDDCKRHVTFIPAAYTDYEMLVGQNGMCSISLVSIARNGAPISPEPIPFQETAFCEDLE